MIRDSFLNFFSSNLVSVNTPLYYPETDQYFFPQSNGTIVYSLSNKEFRKLDKGVYENETVLGTNGPFYSVSSNNIFYFFENFIVDNIEYYGPFMYNATTGEIVNIDGTFKNETGSPLLIYFPESDFLINGTDLKTILLKTPINNIPPNNNIPSSNEDGSGNDSGNISNPPIGGVVRPPSSNGGGSGGVTPSPIPPLIQTAPVINSFNVTENIGTNTLSFS